MTHQPKGNEGRCYWIDCNSMKNKWVELLNPSIRVRSCKKHREASYIE